MKIHRYELSKVKKIFRIVANTCQNEEIAIPKYTQKIPQNTHRRSPKIHPEDPPKYSQKIP
jgi:hypothetical protein